MIVITNTDRASRARTALEAYIAVNGGTSGEDHVDAQDLIGDLMHVLRAENVDPYWFTAHAIHGFTAEEHDPGGFDAGVKVALTVTARPGDGDLQVICEIS